MYLEDYRYVHRYVSENARRWAKQGKEWADLEPHIKEWAEDRYSQILSKKQVSQLHALYEQLAQHSETTHTCAGTQNEPTPTCQRNHVPNMEEPPGNLPGKHDGTD